MPVDDPRSLAFAEVIVRIGLNLRAGQRLLIAEPYELQGVDPAAAPLVAAVEQAARAAGAREVRTLWGDFPRLRRFAENNDVRSFVPLVGDNAAAMLDALQSRDALLFLPSRQPRLWGGLPAGRAAAFHRLAWEIFGPLAQRLTAGETNWTAAPAPTPAWAEFSHAELPAADRLPALWNDVLTALRIPPVALTGPELPTTASPSLPSTLHSLSSTPTSPPSTLCPLPSSPLSAPTLTAWTSHLSSLVIQAADLNRRSVCRVRFTGEGTDLEVTLPAAHRWCTARLQDPAGRGFVANLPTNEIFTAPHKDSAHGTVRVARAISHGGVVIEGLELVFARGEVISASARHGAAAVEELLATDPGARRLGEIAWVPVAPALPPARRFGLALLDENISSHVALGESYAFTSAKPGDPLLNRSLIHLDLPLDATVTFVD